MKLFKTNSNHENLKDKAANKIASGILISQNSFSKTMTAVTKKWKQKQQWVFLYVVCLFFGGFSIIAIVNSFEGREAGKAIIPKSITVSKNIYQQSGVLVITKNEFQQVQEYKRAYPNMQKERPGLFDSLSMVEQIYYSQKK